MLAVRWPLLRYTSTSPITAGHLFPGRIIGVASMRVTPFTSAAARTHDNLLFVRWRDGFEELYDYDDPRMYKGRANTLPSNKTPTCSATGCSPYARPQAINTRHWKRARQVHAAECVER